MVTTRGNNGCILWLLHESSTALWYGYYLSQNGSLLWYYLSQQQLYDYYLSQNRVYNNYGYYFSKQRLYNKVTIRDNNYFILLLLLESP